MSPKNMSKPRLTDDEYMRLNNRLFNIKSTRCACSRIDKEITKILKDTFGENWEDQWNGGVCCPNCCDCHIEKILNDLYMEVI